ncbi:MAG TPA: LysM peptidoglycan-binding domain-containing protein [Acidimicrobiales bacterium]|nr:LysM peptidoglycan-binding domain-containing protein [Acidimicrobiales bacterium]
MAIAALPDVDLTEVPWPRPALRLVEPLEDDGSTEVESVEAWSGDAGPSAVDFVWDAGDGATTWGDEAPSVLSGPDVPARRRSGTSARVRRRRLALGTLVVGLLVALAFPVSALGGRPVPASPATGTAASAGGTVYVVQPGDTLWSIASRADGGSGDPRPLVEALAAQLGTTTVVPGQHVVIP